MLTRSPKNISTQNVLCAGRFLEPGETIEDAVVREVKEEVGLNVTSVEYKFTQPWPFPSQLMIACFCQTDGDTTDLDQDEIEDAVWLSREDLNRIFVGKSPDRIWTVSYTHLTLPTTPYV